MLAKRVFAAFWIFGLVNNVLYVVILSAAVDLVGPLTPKATVLMADVIPSFTLKLMAPFFIHLIPYNVRIFALVGLSFTGMLIVSLCDKVPLILFGIVLASASSGLGETTFLQLTHYFNESSLSAWSSGTGGAGLVGSFAYLVLTMWCSISPRRTLLLFSVVPFTFVFSYFKLLPTVPVSKQQHEAVEVLEEEQQPLSGIDLHISSPPHTTPATPATPTLLPGNWIDIKAHIQVTLNRIKPYLLPYMVPLFTVYVAEYTINQGITPTLLFPIEEMPFSNYRDAYVTYGTLYQFGVFVSRSSGSFVRIRNLSIPTVLQVINLVVCVLQALYVFIPNIYLLFCLVFYEGLLGGSAYVNTFMLVSERTSLTEREFAMGCVGISDSAGIVVAAMIAMFLEPALCGYQVGDGRGYCRMT